MRWSSPREALPSARAGGRNDWQTLRMLLPYLWAYKGRVLVALAFLVGAKLANVGVPMLLKSIVDAMCPKPGDVAGVLVVPVGLLLAYGAAAAVDLAVHRTARTRVRPRRRRRRRAHLALQTFRTCMRCRCASTWSGRPAA